MKKNEERPLSEPRRQSEYAIILILIKFLKNLVRQAWPLLLLIFFSRKDAGITLILIAVFLTIAIFSLMISLLAYYRFYYFIKGEELHIKKGVFRKTEIEIPFERIQSIDFQQNVVHQLLGVIALKVDTAGSKTEEISFDALTKTDAQALRRYILKRKAEMEPGNGKRDTFEEEEPEELILALSPKDLIKVGVSQNHLRTAVLIIFAGFTLLENVDQMIPIDLFDRVNAEAEVWIRSSLFLVLIMIPVFLIISILLTLITTVLKYYNLKFWRTGKGFKLIAGLLNRKENTAKTRKIQIFSWSTNPLKKLFKIFTIKLYKAESEDVIGEKSITVPGCYAGQVEKVRNFIMPEAQHAEFQQHRMHWLLSLRFFLLSGLLPCILATVAGWWWENPLLFLIWLYLPLAVWMTFLYFRKKAIRLHPDFLIADGGVFGEDHQLLESYKIQSVQIRQHFFQRRRSLANLTIFTAAGAIHFRFLPEKKAQDICDFLCYRIEADRRGWM